MWFECLSAVTSHCTTWLGVISGCPYPMTVSHGPRHHWPAPHRDTSAELLAFSSVSLWWLIEIDSCPVIHGFRQITIRSFQSISSDQSFIVGGSYLWSSFSYILIYIKREVIKGLEQACSVRATFMIISGWYVWKCICASLKLSTHMIKFLTNLPNTVKYYLH